MVIRPFTPYLAFVRNKITCYDYESNLYSKTHENYHTFITTAVVYQKPTFSVGSCGRRFGFFIYNLPIRALEMLPPLYLFTIPVSQPFVVSR